MSEGVDKEVFHITKRENGKDSIWTRIGAGFINKDGSLNVVLDALPVDGRIHIRDPRKKGVKNEETNNGYGGGSFAGRPR